MSLRDQFEPYLARWQALEPRERRIVAVGLSVALILAAYAWIWSPLSTDLARLRRIVPRDRTELATMRREAATVRALRESAPRAAGGNLMTRIGRSATASGVRAAIVRMQPSGRYGARIVFDHVDFNALIAWLADLQLQGIHVRRAEIDRRAAQGEVSASLTLAEPHP
ncbi:MAG: type II secretion system protein M [Acidiferrobacteraceae bacterium]